MSDPFQLREDSAVAWLAAKKELEHLVTEANEALLRNVFFLGYANGWDKGAEMAHAAVERIINKATGK